LFPLSIGQIIGVFRIRSEARRIVGVLPLLELFEYLNDSVRVVSHYRFRKFDFGTGRIAEDPSVGHWEGPIGHYFISEMTLFGACTTF
jgi:hypothetical protein